MTATADPVSLCRGAVSWRHCNTHRPSSPSVGPKSAHNQQNRQNLKDKRIARVLWVSSYLRVTGQLPGLPSSQGCPSYLRVTGQLPGLPNSAPGLFLQHGLSKHSVIWLRRPHVSVGGVSIRCEQGLAGESARLSP